MEFNFKLTEEQANVLINSLITKEFKEKLDLINLIQNQAKEQSQTQQYLNNKSQNQDYVCIDESPKEVKEKKPYTGKPRGRKSQKDVVTK